MDVEWIAVDWGTTHLRVWIMGADGAVLGRVESDDGMGALAPDQFEPALLALIGDHLPPGRATPVIACGMVGARQGWAEAPYAAAPCPVPGLAQALRVPASDPRLDIRILPGVSQATPPDVMRGEETQIGGFLAASGGFDGVICLPGTHSKWVEVSAKEIVSFRTALTGELFALLSGQSVLRHSMGGAWDDAAFLEAVADVMGAPQHLGARLFGLRAASLLDGATDGESRLSGLLIGLDIAGTRPYWLGREVVLIGADPLCARYAAALGAQGVTTHIAGADMTLAGLAAAYAGALT